MKLLMIGDIVGQPGRNIVHNLVPGLKEELNIDFVVANGENAAGGNGITRSTADDILASGVDLITGGNHIWDKKDIVEWIDSEPRLIRPANYPPGTPGRGYFISDLGGGIRLAVINLSGRVFMPPIDCPFQTVDALLKNLETQADLFLVDFHGEATSEKMAFGYYVDGRVSAVVGTHTHIQTADARILPKGTAYISDVGMTGPYESVLGVRKELAVASFITRMPQRFDVAKGYAQFNAVVIEFDSNTGKAKNIENIQEFE